ncbi:hypothetical protein I79_008184 [Cricetulus griseus]|uniref:Uncharacterized protein n=1 Tax=Cricetulus griseus TaxID=10029 RepID=G3HCH4_CRIGR|nr:hypothetical protein I79_008184 [Cricetulus griseus]
MRFLLQKPYKLKALPTPVYMLKSTRHRLLPETWKKGAENLQPYSKATGARVKGSQNPGWDNQISSPRNLEP